MYFQDWALLITIIVWVVALIIFIPMFAVWRSSYNRRLRFSWGAAFVTLGIVTSITLIAYGAVLLFGQKVATAQAQSVLNSEKKIGLVALGTDEGVSGEYHGGIFLSVGMVEEKQYIKFISGDNDMGYSVRQVQSNDALIREVAEDPYMIEGTWDFVTPWWKGTLGEYTTYGFYVPEGTVKYNFEVAP